LKRLRELIAERIPHDPAQHALHAEILAKAGRLDDAERERELARTAGLRE
jgi:hypothetical protein